MLKRSILTAGMAFAVALVPFAASAQGTPDQRAADAALRRKQEAMHNAYASKDPRRIAETRAAARDAYHADWAADHNPHGRNAVRQAEAARARARAEMGMAYKSKDPRRITAAREKARRADQAAWAANHRT